MIKFNCVSKLYSSVKHDSILALDAIDFEIKQGECIGLIGNNGCGKTTILSLIADFIRPTFGKITITPNNASIGFVSADILFDQNSTLGYLLKLFKRIHRGKYNEEFISKLISELELDVYLKIKLNEMSTGIKRRSVFLLSILHNPDIVLLDEIFNGLDRDSKNVILSVLMEMKNQGKTIIMASHQMEPIQSLCSRLIYLYKGKVLMSSDIIDNNILDRYDKMVNDNEKNN